MMCAVRCVLMVFLLHHPQINLECSNYSSVKVPTPLPRHIRTQTRRTRCFPGQTFTQNARAAAVSLTAV